MKDLEWMQELTCTFHVHVGKKKVSQPFTRVNNINKMRQYIYYLGHKIKKLFQEQMEGLSPIYLSERKGHQNFESFHSKWGLIRILYHSLNLYMDPSMSIVHYDSIGPA